MSQQAPPTPRTDIKADERARWRIQAEWTTQATLVNVGLIVLGVYVVSALITSGPADIASKVAIVAWAAAMPLLAVLSLTTALQRTRTYASYPLYYILAGGVAQGSAVLGFGAALWHVWYVASVVFAVMALAALFLYQAYYRRIERDNQPDRPHRKAR